MNKNMFFKGFGFLMVVVVVSIITACANSSRASGPGGGNSGGNGGGRPQGPPPEAIEACSGKTEGDVVSFSGRRGETLEATCQMIEDQLVAVPEGHEERPRQ